MLDIIRNLVASIFGKVLLGIMVLSFAFWGVGDLLNSGNSQLAAKVGNKKITIDDFYYEFQRSIDDFNLSIGRKISNNEAFQQNIHTLVINEMVYDKMIDVFSDNNNIYVSDQILKKVIKSMPQFQNDNGSFNKTLYEYTLQNNFPSEKVFIDKVKNLYLKAHIFDLFNSDLSLNEKIYDLIVDFETETRDFEYFVINGTQFNKPDISNQELLEFYEDKKAEFRVPKKTIMIIYRSILLLKQEILNLLDLIRLKTLRFIENY